MADNLPIGVILPFGGPTAPAGYLLCYGQAVSRSEYASLFTVLGTTFGTGDGLTTFNVPDLRGRVPAGQDDMGGVSADRLTGQSGGVNGDNLGAAGGAETHTLTVAELAAHTHTGTTDNDGAHTHQIGYTTGNPGSANGSYFNPDALFPEPYVNYELLTISGNNIVPTSGAHTHNFTTNSAGSDSPHNNVQPTLILNYVIKSGEAADFYVTEDGEDFYVTEDGADNYIIA